VKASTVQVYLASCLVGNAQNGIILMMILILLPMIS